MFRNQYDQDMLTWSPQGRLHQVECAHPTPNPHDTISLYLDAMEAVKQGSTVVACGNENCVVLAALKRKQSKLSSTQEKIFMVNSKVGVAVSGLSTDGTGLVKFLREESSRAEFVYDLIASPSKLASRIAKSLQISTRQSNGRPCGVGLVLVGTSKEFGCQIFQSCPSGDVSQMRCTSIGARSQSARTFLEKNKSVLEQATMDEVIMIALRALRESSTDVDTAHFTSDKFELLAIDTGTCQLKTPGELDSYLRRL